MQSAESLLHALRLDELSIRLDCTGQQLSEQCDRFSVCGIRLATEFDVLKSGYLEDAVVPEHALPLEPADLAGLSPFLADPATPSGLRIGFGTMPMADPVVARMLNEAGKSGFQPHYGSTYQVGPYEGRLIDVLTADPGTMTTTVLDPRIQQYSETRLGTWMGMHYDNAWTTTGEGERFPAAERIASADRRVLYNAGPGPRRLVTALTLNAVQLSGRVRPDDGRNIPDTRQLQSYLRDNPGEIDSVVCLVTTLSPGDYIVFPAGVVMHDGSMDGLTEQSRAIVLGGRF